MDVTRKKFKEIFTEDKDENLTLKIKIKVKGGQTVAANSSFTRDQEIGGVNFHKYRYFDFAGEELQDGTFNIVGVYPEDK